MRASLLTLLGMFGMALCQQPGYLPPAKNGYNYNPPSVPFTPGPNNLNPTKVPYPSPRPQPPPSPRPPQPPQQPHEHHEHHHEPGMPFDFNYAVNEIEYGNDYSHKANSDGDVTRGEYRIQLPDGRLQVVKYTADWKNGYNAEVSYEGEAKYPDQPVGQPSNNYQPPSGGYKY